MSKLAIDVQNLTKIFDTKIAVDHISLRVKKGAIFGFLGANGSGKTTTIRMICGLITPTEGKGTCLGYDIITQSEEIKKNIGYMPQIFSYYRGLSVYENLRFIADIFQIDNAEKSINTLMKEIGLEPYRNVHASNLSGGWKQQLSLACSVLHKPQLLFLDEPTAGVDPKARKEFWDYLQKISMDGTTILVTTHYMDEVEKCSDIAYINQGKLLYTGTTKNLILDSNVKSYMLDGHAEEQHQILKKIHALNPDIVTSITNNELRISSTEEHDLRGVMHKLNGLNFKAVRPSFEEVFIGLIP